MLQIPKYQRSGERQKTIGPRFQNIHAGYINMGAYYLHIERRKELTFTL